MKRPAVITKSRPGGIEECEKGCEKVIFLQRFIPESSASVELTDLAARRTGLGFLAGGDGGGLAGDFCKNKKNWSIKTLSSIDRSIATGLNPFRKK